MLDPSSSEEESDDLLEGDPSKDAPVAGGSGGSSASTGARSLPTSRGSDGRDSGRSGSARSVSPSPSVASEKEREEQERIQREEEDTKKRKALQLYVFLLRCIAYPFNAKQPTDMARRQQKVDIHNVLQATRSMKGMLAAICNNQTLLSSHRVSN